MYSEFKNYRWFNIDKDQAGAQRCRGCMEQIFCLRLLVDYCMFKKNKLHVVFVEFQKAYDKIPRKSLIECLKVRACGKTMLLAFLAAYKCTKMVLNGTTIATNIGARQGAPTSCLFFVLYIDDPIGRLKTECLEDNF